ncbi:GGDEF domain-containing protein [Pseudomonas schmalbachii]|uniref:diguanylate cyclase n=1 Tax=Pseudomonas schmalbachii TaxID=2816993 RepID=A0ABS3TU52_9PSED|nr:GGDEF domain-containing protein [Pseudomonas schmalbachii]MBO3276104.1 GGDEF domain-containing protein [Pseudomonas schmalbachii]
MSRDDSQRWKTRYLENLEQQERIERRWKSRLDLLRRGLVRSSLAAEGSDKAVDQCMQELREILRREEMDAGLARLIPRLEQTVLDSERRRQQSIRQTVEALARITQQLLALDMPNDVRTPLKRFARDIEARASQIREMPALLEELSDLQDKALESFSESSATQKPGLLQRILGREQPAAQPTENAPATPPEPIEPAAAPQNAILLDCLPLSAELFQPAEPSAREDVCVLASMPEPPYSSVAPHIEASLLRLLDQMQLPIAQQAQADALRSRIQDSLNWYELVPVLDDLAVLVLSLNDGSQREFEGYLKRLNERLSAFLGSLEEMHQGHADSAAGARNLDEHLREQVSDLQDSVLQATDLEALKLGVEGRLEGLLDTLERFRRERENREQEVAERLQELMARVSSMEEEAREFQASIEDQRVKALTDPLTGLPNRAALDERLELEVERWRRYGGDLLLAVLDVDHFKRINDEFGHLAGDKVLKIIAAELAKRLRRTDFIARYGGEEFVMLLPSTSLENGQQLLEALRNAIADCPFHFRGKPLAITCSAGLAQFAPGDRSETVFERADQALYRAKRSGRNRLETV